MGACAGICRAMQRGQLADPSPRPASCVGCVREADADFAAAKEPASVGRSTLRTQCGPELAQRGAPLPAKRGAALPRALRCQPRFVLSVAGRGAVSARHWPKLLGKLHCPRSCSGPAPCSARGSRSAAAHGAMSLRQVLSGALSCCPRHGMCSSTSIGKSTHTLPLS